MNYRYLSPLLLLLGLPNAHADYDYVTARIPHAQQRIAPAALAEFNILLYRAGRSAAETLCEGNWLVEGRLVHQSGPLPVTTADGTLVWFYSAAREAAPLPCAGISRQQFFQEMRRHLPDWVTLDSAAAGKGKVASAAATTPSPAP